MVYPGPPRRILPRGSNAPSCKSKATDVAHRRLLRRAPFLACAARSVDSANLRGSISSVSAPASLRTPKLLQSPLSLANGKLLAWSEGLGSWGCSIRNPRGDLCRTGKFLQGGRREACPWRGAWDHLSREVETVQDAGRRLSRARGWEGGSVGAGGAQSQAGQQRDLGQTVKNDLGHISLPRSPSRASSLPKSWSHFLSP